MWVEEKLMAGAGAAVTVASLRRAGTPEGCSVETELEGGRAEEEDVAAAEAATATAVATKAAAGGRAEAEDAAAADDDTVGSSARSVDTSLFEIMLSMVQAVLRLGRGSVDL